LLFQAEYIKFVDEIPLTGVGRIQKFKLQGLALKELKKRKEDKRCSMAICLRIFENREDES
jgi:acyl-coenzyme A synthetase/AMP-(fatty) acid ligase